MKNPTVVLSTFITVAFMACDTEKVLSPVADSKHFEFIKPGHRSVYDLKETWADPTVPYGKWKSIQTITSDLGKGKYKMVDSTFFENNLDSMINNFVWHKDENAWSMVDSYKNDAKTLILRTHPVKGETIYQIHNADTMRCEVISEKELIAIPLGDFECVKVHMHGPMFGIQYDSFLYYNFKYGLIKEDTRYYKNGEQVYAFSQIMSAKNF